MRVLDVSFPIRTGMPTFPGDPPVEVEPAKRIADGDPYDLSALRLGSHTGTHVDPPRHFVPGGAGIDAVDPARLNGPARVVHLPRAVRSIGAREAGAVPEGSERVLFRTSNSERWHERMSFFGDFVAVAPEGAEELVRRGVRLVGIDALSIERDETERYPVHHRLLGSDILIVEGLLLFDAPEGEHELRCLPLRIADGDGGPARALLLTH
jgi:arylformamidase